jgi:hypothetical protein
MKNALVRHVQRARQRRLEMHAMAAHPVAARRRRADRQPRQLLVGQAAGHLQQILPVLFFGVASTSTSCGASCMQRSCGCAMSCRRAIRAARLRAASRWRPLRGPSARRKGGIAAADHQDVDHDRAS